RSYHSSPPATPTTEPYTLSLHDALPISRGAPPQRAARAGGGGRAQPQQGSIPGRPLSRASNAAQRDLWLGPDAPERGHRREHDPDRKSTRLNSSHVSISYAVFCLKKKKK